MTFRAVAKFVPGRRSSKISHGARSFARLFSSGGPAPNKAGERSGREIAKLTSLSLSMGNGQEGIVGAQKILSEMGREGGREGGRKEGWRRPFAPHQSEFSAKFHIVHRQHQQQRQHFRVLGVDNLRRNENSAYAVSGSMGETSLTSR